MKVFSLFSLLITQMAFGGSLKNSCDEWNQVKPIFKHVREYQVPLLEAYRFHFQGFESSQLFVVDEEEQKSVSIIKPHTQPIYHNFLVCSAKGVKDAKEVALEKKGVTYLSQISNWGASYEEKFREGWSFPAGLKNPVKGVFGLIQDSLQFKFYDIWSAYEQSLKHASFDEGCDLSDHPCVRRAQHLYTESFENYLKPFPRLVKERFKEKVRIKNKIRDLEWEMRKI